jgi:hypothetical protein
MAGIVHGGLLRDGTLPKSAADAAFQAFLADLLSKGNGGQINGDVVFNKNVSLMGASARLSFGTGAGINLDSSTSFTTAANILSTATPTLAGHLSTKGYVDSALANGLAGRNWVAAARAVATSNVALSGAPTAVDGVALAAGDRVLLVGQTAAAENGVYSYNGTDLIRADDANSAAELVNLTIWVSEGATRADMQYTCTADKSLVLGTGPVNFVQTGGAGMMLAGWGVGITGNTVAVKYAAPVAPSAGAINGANKVFTFAGVRFAAGGECVELDGVRVYKTADYTVSVSGSNTVVSFVSPPPAGSRVMLGGFLA